MKCNNCGHEMDDGRGNVIIGFAFSNNPESQHPEAIRFRQRYGVDAINICMVCLAQGLGLRRSTYANQT